jgi:hypothetical protein
MKLLGLIILTVMILLVETTFLHQDRIERPANIQFVFENQDPINLNTKDSSLVKLYCKEILKGKKRLRECLLSFETGETVLFQYMNSLLAKIKLTDGKKELHIQKEVVNKIKEIHYQTVALLWNGRCKNALEAGYCYIQFEIGTAKSYGKYPYVQLFFKDMNLFKPTICRPISENAVQSSDF